MGFLSPSVEAEFALAKVHGFHSTQVILVSLGMDTRRRVVQLKNQTQILSVPRYLPASSSLESAADHLHALAWSVLPGLSFCEKAKMALLLALVSASPGTSIGARQPGAIRNRAGAGEGGGAVGQAALCATPSGGFSIMGTPMPGTPVGSHKWSRLGGTPIVASNAGSGPRPSSPTQSVAGSAAGLA